MTLEKVKREAVRKNPNLVLLYGAPKVGKTTVLTQLKDCLIIDTEHGADMLDGYVYNVNNRDDLVEFYHMAEQGHKYKYFALDTIDKLVEWTEKAVCVKYEVEDLSALPYGKGWYEVRTKVMNHVKLMQSLADHVILIGHRKIASSVENSTAVDPESLDFSGKLKNMIMSACDAIGYMYRDEESELVVSFQGGTALEAGSRCHHLRGEIFLFDWNKIYVKEKVDESNTKQELK